MSSMEEHFFSAGYILIKVGSHDVHDVRDKLLAVDGVRIAHPLLGSDDLICYLETYDPASFRRALNCGIRQLIEGGFIERTETMIILAEEGRGYSGSENRPAPAAAWLLCDVSVTDPEKVIGNLLAIPGVVNAHPILGRYDLVAYVEAASMEELMRIIDEDVRNVEGMKNTDTRLVLMKIAKEMPSRNRDKQKSLGMQSA